MKTRIAIAVLATSALLVPRLAAHHSFAATYDGSKSLRIQGKLTKVEWTNPHSFFYIEVTDDSGKSTTWACEGAAPNALTRRGFKKGDIKFGDVLIIDGYQAKDGSQLMDAARVVLPDGRVIAGIGSGDAEGKGKQ